MTQSLKSGALLQGGKYEIIRPLGQGGFGITYLADQKLMDRKVCIKEFFVKEYCEREGETSSVSLGTTSNAEMMQKYMSKFIKEAKTIARMDHQNIVRIHDVFKENNTAYIVMEYIDGLSLGEYMKKYGPLSEDVALGYIHKVGEALSYAHSQKVMHLDVKPSNIMLDLESNRPVLIDFGLSKQYTEEGEQTSSTPIGISQGFAPLEQYQTGGVREFSPSTDIYSLGATLYALLTGKTPPTASEVNEDGLPIAEKISKKSMSAIESAMQPRRKARPQTVEAFLELLDVNTTVTTNTSQEQLSDTTILMPNKTTEKSPISNGIATKLPRTSFSSDAHLQRNMRPKHRKKMVWGVVGGVAVGFVLTAVLLLTRGGTAKDTIPDQILIDGSNSLSVIFDSDASQREFNIEKNFDDRWTYSGVPEWCAAKGSEGKITIAVLENASSEEREGQIIFKKIGTDVILGKLLIKQTGVEKNVAKTETSEKIALKSIALSESSAQMSVGESMLLYVHFNPSNATKKTVEWTSTNTNVASVTSAGKVSALNVGSTTILASVEGVKDAYCNITVKDVDLSSNASSTVRNGIETSNTAYDDRISALKAENRALVNELKHLSGEVFKSSIPSSLSGLDLTSALERENATIKNKIAAAKSKPKNGTLNGHDWVDLGLSVKWATCNVGARNESDYGSYFAWAEVSVKSYYNWSVYKFSSDRVGNKFSKYVADPDSGVIDNKTSLEASDDAARNSWGSTWRMPTPNEVDELCSKCKWTWTSQGGNTGCLVTGPNNQSIFLPAAGYWGGDSLDDAGKRGYYWSSGLYKNSSDEAMYLYFNNRDHVGYHNYRGNGFTIRPVTK